MKNSSILNSKIGDGWELLAWSDSGRKSARFRPPRRLQSNYYSLHKLRLVSKRLCQRPRRRRFVRFDRFYSLDHRVSTKDNKKKGRVDEVWQTRNWKLNRFPNFSIDPRVFSFVLVSLFRSFSFFHVLRSRATFSPRSSRIRRPWVTRFSCSIMKIYLYYYFYYYYYYLLYH